MGFFDKFSRKKPGEVKKEAKPLPKAAPKADATKEAKKEKKEAKKGALAKDLGGESYRIIVKPLFTEKSAMLEASGKYTFLVSTKATKVSVAQAVRDLYGIKPTSVRMVVSKGKLVRFGRSIGREKDEKKAIVSLPKGQTISLVEGA